ncbi:hypothetical protein NECAME_03389 [Necator americanus]|uniref:Uncharacterized protein n=1 Tax=Necator americanus TaxID=51031 RepID=W2T541_NECAM|nr:hypothetical protein NECAME_03389 [Necator americanus]ETN76719.1 hypothetical protein NECAME_03389 [Necator americanus]
MMADREKMIGYQSGKYLGLGCGIKPKQIKTRGPETGNKCVREQLILGYFSSLSFDHESPPQVPIHKSFALK